MMKHSIILIAVLATAALVAMVATRQLAVKQGAPQTERTETSAPADITIGLSLEQTSAGSVLSVSMSPADEEQKHAVSTFALELTVALRDGTSIQTAGQIKANEALIEDSWSFPILSATPSDSEGLVVKLSGVHIATSPYQLTARQVIARIPIDPSVEPDDLVVTLGSEHTKFLTKDATPIPVDENVVVKGSAE